MIRGEWWIQKGNITYCDGDYGDANHEMIVKSQAIIDLADWFGCSLPDVNEPSLDQLLDALGLTSDTGVDDLLAKCEATNQVPLWQIAVDSRNIDSRAYAMREWGWHAVRGNHIETWEITDKVGKEIIQGIWAILAYDCEEIDPNGVLYVNGTKGRRCVILTGSQIEAGEWPDGQNATPSEPMAPSAALAAMDRQLEHPYYRE